MSHTQRYLAFDIETAKDVPGPDFDWRSHRPLGICCAAALPSDTQAPVLWHGKTPTGEPSPQLTQIEARQLVDTLQAYVKQGYTLLTWNGLGFDLNVLAEESGAYDECKMLARNHVDMMFHVFCEQGYPIALDKVARAMGLAGKPVGMSGERAPKLWADGQFQQVLDYVSGDVRLTLDVALACERIRRLEWFTRRGKRSTLMLTHWYTVSEAMRLPQADTSWMDAPIPRNEFTGWLGSADSPHVGS